MVAVIFEAIPNVGQRDEYFKIATALRPALEKIDGFISIERFQGFNDLEKVLFLSFWKDEESISNGAVLKCTGGGHSQKAGKAYLKIII